MTKRLPALETMAFNPTIEAVVDTLCERTQNDNRQFFRLLVTYNMCKVASMMRASVLTHDRGSIPVNMYAINLASSGFGKGYSTNIMEDEVLHLFRETFLEKTFEILSENNLDTIANRRAARKGTATDDERLRVDKEFDALGPLLFAFDSGTSPAVKQMRQKLLMANAGSMNFECDEIGSNLINQIDVMNVFLELYDVGKVKQKLVKSSAENQRNEEIHGRTPCNMMLFGTPSKLLNGGKTEEELMSFLEAGYGRRCLFGYSRHFAFDEELTPEDVYDMMTNTASSQTLINLANQLKQLADPMNFGREIPMEKEVALQVIEYKLMCERYAAKMPEHEEIRRAEMTHRYFKALKVAGAFAFIEQSDDITEEHLYSAIALVEESGKGLNALLARERPYVKLAQYIAGVNGELTHADLVEELPFYKGTNTQKQEMLTLAIAWAYKNNIVIKKSFTEGIEFLSGESLKETNLDNILMAASDDIAYGYENQRIKWDEIGMVGENDGYHWINHWSKDGHRHDDKMIPGFNLLVLDIDNDVSLDTAKMLMKDYTYYIYTTKRHTDAEHRFRMIIPTNFELRLDGDDYKEFMSNVYEFLPFKSDEQTGQRARKWLTHAGETFTNEGQLFDVLPFIPKTTKNEARQAANVDLSNLSNLERWFCNNTGKGNRSNQLIKYALMLVDAGGDVDYVTDAVIALNDKLPNKLPEPEIHSTIMVTASKAIIARAKV